MHFNKKIKLTLLSFLFISLTEAQTFKVSYSSAAANENFSGKVILYLSKDTKSPKDASLGIPKLACYAVNVNNIKPNTAIVFDDKAILNLPEWSRKYAAMGSQATDSYQDKNLPPSRYHLQPHRVRRLDQRNFPGRSGPQDEQVFWPFHLESQNMSVQSHRIQKHLDSRPLQWENCMQAELPDSVGTHARTCLPL